MCVSVCICLCLGMFVTNRRNLAPCFKQAVTVLPILTWQSLAPVVLRLHFETCACLNALRSHYNNHVVKDFSFGLT